jgi:oligoendopeptidase F
MNMKQKETYQQSRWSLDELYSDGKSKKFMSDLKKLESLKDEFVSSRSKLSPKMKMADFHQLISMLQEMTEIGTRLSGFSFLRFAENTMNADAMALVGQIQAKLALITNETLFFSLWWKSLSDIEAAPFFKATPDYQYFLQEIRNTKPFTLTEDAEQIINLKNISGSEALTTLYDAITNRYQFFLTVDGKKQTLTRGELMKHVKSEKPAMRKKAYQELYRVYGNDSAILGQIYQTIARDWHLENINLRKYPTPISVRNRINDIPDEVVDLLLDTSVKNREVFQRYFKVKKDLLGLKTFNRYDIYAPLKESEKKYSFSQAYEMVYNAFNEFDPEFAKMARQVFAENHVDSEIRPGKQGGAFCSTLGPKHTPWVLLNYNGNIGDVSTMAHELGHAIHSLSANQHHIFHQGSCLPLAETASTFGEMLLTDSILKENPGEDLKLQILMEQMDDNYATIQRQAYFALFEKQAHEMIPQGVGMDDLNQAYLENLQDQFGDAVHVNEEFRLEWICIPHIFHTPFYVYAYAFGQLLVLSLYKRYKNEGKSFIPQYKKILAAGGAKAPETVLSDAGINFRDAAFWQGGFDILNENLSEIERICKK